MKDKLPAPKRPDWWTHERSVLIESANAIREIRESLFYSAVITISLDVVLIGILIYKAL